MSPRLLLPSFPQPDPCSWPQVSGCSVTPRSGFPRGLWEPQTYPPFITFTPGLLRVPTSLVPRSVCSKCKSPTSARSDTLGWCPAPGVQQGPGRSCCWRPRATAAAHRPSSPFTPAGHPPRLPVACRVAPGCSAWHKGPLIWPLPPIQPSLPACSSPHTQAHKPLQPFPSPPDTTLPTLGAISSQVSDLRPLHPSCLSLSSLETSLILQCPLCLGILPWLLQAERAPVWCPWLCLGSRGP